MASIRTPSVRVTVELAATLVRAGGYTHPLFHPEDPLHRPLPGQAVLLLMGGLVEQSGALDHAVALLEVRRARFGAMVRSGSQVVVEVAEGGSEPVTRGRARQTVTWTAYDGRGIEVASADVLMLVREADGGEQ